MMIHMVIKKKQPAFTLSEKKYPVFQPVEKKYPGFQAEEKKKTVSPKITQAPPRNSNGPSLKCSLLGFKFRKYNSSKCDVSFQTSSEVSLNPNNGVFYSIFLNLTLTF